MEKNTCFPLLPGQGWNFLWLCILNKAPFQAPMIHSMAHAHMPYVRRPCQDAHAPFELEDSSTGFVQSSFIHITGVFCRGQGKPESWDRLPWCWGMAMPRASLLQKGMGSSAYIRVTGSPVKPLRSGCQPVFLHPTPIPAGFILPMSSPNAPYTRTKLRPALALLSQWGSISAVWHRSLALLLSL